MKESLELNYRPDASWTGVERGTSRLDLLALALAFLSGAIALGTMLA
jgi:hypothetical protein